MPGRLRNFIFAIISLMPLTPAMAGTLEQDVLDEINFVRAHPQKYAQELRRYRQAFDGRLVMDANGDRMTFEGVRAVDDAIRFLERQRPLAPLAQGSVLGRAAADHVDEQGQRGSTGHFSANGMGPARRVALRGGGSYVSETISYGFSDAVSVVRNLIVDDGVPSRGHRSVIFLSFLRYAGVGCGPHARADYMCVIDFSQTADGRASAPDRIARSWTIGGEEAQPF